jgi:TPR repeat protein
MQGNGGLPKDMDAGAKWFRKAAVQGLMQAQFKLAECYDRGDGVPRDQFPGTINSQAYNWYRKSAEQGYAQAQVVMGSCCLAYGVPTRDPAVAKGWWEKAAAQGSADAQHMLDNNFPNVSSVADFADVKPVPSAADLAQRLFDAPLADVRQELESSRAREVVAAAALSPRGEAPGN